MGILTCGIESERDRERERETERDRDFQTAAMMKPSYFTSGKINSLFSFSRPDPVSSFPQRVKRH